MVPILDSAKNNHCQFHAMPLKEREHTLQTIREKKKENPSFTSPKLLALLTKLYSQTSVSEQILF